MSESVRALIIIVVLAACVFWASAKALVGTAVTPAEFKRRRNLWFAITAIAFLSPNIWLYIIASAGVLLYGRTKEDNWLAMFLCLIFVVPQIAGRVPGFGIVDYLFNIDFLRLIALAVLLPAFLVLRKRKGTLPFGSVLPDKLLLGFLAVEFGMRLQATTVTDSLRSGVFYAFVDAFLPYYVASRGAACIREFRGAIAAFAVTTLVMALLAVFEYSKHWLLYHSLSSSLGGAEFWPWTYLPRDGGLRAPVSVGQPIPLGLVLMLGIGFLLYLRPFVKSKLLWRGAMALLAAGLVATISRGPWVGAIALVLVYLATGPSAVKDLFKAGLVGCVLTAGLLVSPLGERVINLIPFVGNVEPQNAEYRQLFIQQSIPVIKRHPWFGSVDFVNAPEFKDLKPQGLLDTLNVFVTVALAGGLVGLLAYAGMLISAGVGIYRSFRRQRGRNEELYTLGRALLAVLVGMFITFNTTSPITVIPLIYWVMIGLGVGYIELVRKTGTGGKPGIARAETTAPLVPPQSPGRR